MNPTDTFDAVGALQTDVPYPDEAAVDRARLDFVQQVAANQGGSRGRKKSRSVPRSLRAGGVSFAVLLALVGTAVATGFDPLPAGTVDESKTYASFDHVLGLPIFQTASSVSLTESGDRPALEKVIEGSGSGSVAASMNLASARSVVVPGSDSLVWIVASDDDQLCVFTPANEGFNSSCGGPSTIRKTGILSVSGGSEPNSLLAVGVGPQGAEGITVTGSDGSKREVQLRDGVAVTHIRSDDVVTNGVATFSIEGLSSNGP